MRRSLRKHEEECSTYPEKFTQYIQGGFSRAFIDQQLVSDGYDAQHFWSVLSLQAINEACSAVVNESNTVPSTSRLVAIQTQHVDLIQSVVRDPKPTPLHPFQTVSVPTSTTLTMTSIWWALEKFQAFVSHHDHPLLVHQSSGFPSSSPTDQGAAAAATTTTTTTTTTEATATATWNEYPACQEGQHAKLDVLNDSTSTKALTSIITPEMPVRVSPPREKQEEEKLDMERVEKKFRVVCISDTHGLHDALLPYIPPGDILIHAGDFTDTGDRQEVIEFDAFLAKLPHRYKIVIAGNHESTFDRRSYPTQYRRYGHAIPYDCDEVISLIQHAVYLEDEGVDIEGLSIYGTPWQPEFCDWAFNLPRGSALEAQWAKIPGEDVVDILITHTPPLGRRDEIEPSHLRVVTLDFRVGDVHLLREVQQRVKPKVHVFGHVHEGYGCSSDGKTLYINASSCTSQYQAINMPISFEIIAASSVSHAKTGRVVEEEKSLFAPYDQLIERQVQRRRRYHAECTREYSLVGSPSDALFQRLLYRRPVNVLEHSSRAMKYLFQDVKTTMGFYEAWLGQLNQTNRKHKVTTGKEDEEDEEDEEANGKEKGKGKEDDGERMETLIDAAMLSHATVSQPSGFVNNSMQRPLDYSSRASGVEDAKTIDSLPHPLLHCRRCDHLPQSLQPPLQPPPQPPFLRSAPMRRMTESILFGFHETSEGYPWPRTLLPFWTVPPSPGKALASQPRRSEKSSSLSPTLFLVDDVVDDDKQQQQQRGEKHPVEQTEAKDRDKVVVVGVDDKQRLGCSRASCSTRQGNPSSLASRRTCPPPTVTSRVNPPLDERDVAANELVRETHGTVSRSQRALIRRPALRRLPENKDEGDVCLSGSSFASTSSPLPLLPSPRHRSLDLGHATFQAAVDVGDATMPPVIDMSGMKKETLRTLTTTTNTAMGFGCGPIGSDTGVGDEHGAGVGSTSGVGAAPGVGVGVGAAPGAGAGAGADVGADLGANDVSEKETCLLCCYQVKGHVHRNHPSLRMDEDVTTQQQQPQQQMTEELVETHHTEGPTTTKDMGDVGEMKVERVEDEAQAATETQQHDGGSHRIKPKYSTYRSTWF